MAITVRLANDISDLAVKASEEAIQRALEECGIVAEGYAKQYLTLKGAVDTGRLRNSVTHAVKDNTMYVGTNVEYAPYIEFGTSNPKRSAREYIKPSIADHITQYQAILRSELEKKTL